MFKRALVSVSNKSGLVEFLKPLVENGLEVVSSGGTYNYLKENGIAATEVNEVTGFPEVLGGRVKTLHPHIHAPILARWDVVSDMETLGQLEFAPFDLVIVNLYPFEEQLEKGFTDQKPMIEFIDVGGPTLLRAAAKNHKFVTVICDPNDYGWIKEKRTLNLTDRAKLATKVFLHTSVYDSVIARTLNDTLANEQDKSVFTLGARLHKKLRYGENPQQEASWYKDPYESSGWHQAEFVQGKELSYNNLLDLEAAAMAVQDIGKKHACVIVKHNSPCGLAFGETIDDAFKKALAADPVSAFGGAVAINSKLTAEVATEMNNIFLECIVAPEIDPKAGEILAKKENLRVLQINFEKLKPSKRLVKSISGGVLVQNVDLLSNQFLRSWKFATSDSKITEIKESTKSDLLLAWIAAAHLKSNAIAIASGGQSIGLGMGQVNRVDAVKQAILRMQTMHPQVQNAVLASDAFFPFSDSIKAIAEAGIHWVIQPGGSKKDAEVISAAKDLGVNIILTGTRHFRH